MSKAMGLYWTNLAKLGTPNSHDVPVEWPMYDESNDRHLVLANQIKSDSGLSKKFCDFWDSLPRMGPYPTEPRD